MASQKKKRTKSEVNPAQGSLVASERTKAWITLACHDLYFQIKAEINTPLIAINFPDFVPEIIGSRMVALVVGRLEQEGHQLPNMIVNATR